MIVNSLNSSLYRFRLLVLSLLHPKKHRQHKHMAEGRLRFVYVSFIALMCSVKNPSEILSQNHSMEIVKLNLAKLLSLRQGSMNFI